MLLTTFYSTNVNNYNQSAGNSIAHDALKRGSSETIRGSSFDLFRYSYEKIFKQPLPAVRVAVRPPALKQNDD
jgi:hypothetical protein